MFANVAIAVLVGVLALLAVYHVARAKSARAKSAHALDGQFRNVDRLVYALFFLSMLVMACTAYYGVIVQRAPMTGYVLMLHASGAGAFLGALVLLVVAWAEACRFRARDCSCASVAEKAKECTPRPERFSCGQKFWFWAMVFFALMTAFTMLFSMLPLFGTDWMKKLDEAHRESSLLLLVAFLAHGYLLLTAKRAPKA